MAAQTRRDILLAARRLFTERGYAATSITEIAQEAEVAVQTIYSRLGSKGGIVLALQDLLDEEAGVREGLAEVSAAETPQAALRVATRVTRTVMERCGDIVGVLVAGASVEPELATALAEGHRRHRFGSRRTVERIAELGGLQAGVPVEHATALLATLTWHPSWTELVGEAALSWDQAEDLLADSLERMLLAPQ